jgi:hypothetical protein
LGNIIIIIIIIRNRVKPICSPTSFGEHNYPWMKENQVCANKGPGPLLREDNYKNVKLGWGHLKIFFSKTTW